MRDPIPIQVWATGLCDSGGRIKNLQWSSYRVCEIKHWFTEKMKIDLYLQDEVSFCEDFLWGGAWNEIRILDYS